ncbi:RNA recognition domain-containing protein 2 [Colletotrichum graminicola M1.001]|uniref:RNA recognition domain-containing protein 2 n=1 Tax=Colletotrichum graminicola (strain M1.001 / M2 / FGSC 10212) TaxID=645133 RepID=E3R0W9_COLGM|nr:RNA recognition domain-containing protein 2 [Colletotrichum graminicola M1.001]EFQ36757.1 RNA recognition domain-containing protein 2 [Colletotrichum graminicola M1.001]
MAHSRETDMFNPSSPRSSIGGAESFKGTPDTRLTAFSPEGGSTRSSRLLKSTSQDSLETTPSRYSTSAFGSVTSSAEKDPFIAVKPNSGHQKLSPTASTFQPFSCTPEKNRNHPTPDRNQQSLLPGQKYEAELSRSLSVCSPGRNLGIADLNACFAKLQRLGLSVQEPTQIQCKGGKLYVQFSDIRDAVLVRDNIHRVGAGYEADYLSDGDFYEHVHRESNNLDLWVSVVVVASPPGLLDVSRTEAVIKRMLDSQGQLSAFYVQHSYDPSVFRAFSQFHDPSRAASAVVSFDNKLVEVSAHSLSDIYVLHPEQNLTIDQGAHMTLSLVESSDISHMAQDRVATPDSLSHGMSGDLNNTLQALALSKPAPQMHMVPHSASMSGPNPPYSPFGIQVPPFAMWPILCQPQFQPHGPYLLNEGQRLPSAPAMSSPTAYQFSGPVFSHSSHTVSATGSMSPISRNESRRQGAARVNRSPYYNVASHHNHVDVNRIREGIDVRTTIMLRNIPNKVDQAMLKRIVDESSWGKYDFMYLRIDFANDCNVGYAFINFVDFVNTRGNQRWNCFKSDKVAEISYATIQGKDCLVQKFRNSSVMLEAAHYRPKLFYTSNGPVPGLAGEEEPFPQPDNQSKMKRSCENAEHVGLFTPNAGQHFRDEQRRRRSQYDRGTRLAALEEHDLDASMQLYIYHSQ